MQKVNCSIVELKISIKKFNNLFFLEYFWFFVIQISGPAVDKKAILRLQQKNRCNNACSKSRIDYFVWNWKRKAVRARNASTF